MLCLFQLLGDSSGGLTFHIPQCKHSVAYEVFEICDFKLIYFKWIYIEKKWTEILVLVVHQHLVGILHGYVGAKVQMRFVKACLVAFFMSVSTLLYLKLNISGCLIFFVRLKLYLVKRFWNFRFENENMFGSVYNLCWFQFKFVVKNEYKYLIRGQLPLQRLLRITDWWCRIKNLLAHPT